MHPDRLDGRFFESYRAKLDDAMAAAPVDGIARLASALMRALGDGSHVFLAGNGGSAANAVHLANDFLYGMGRGARAGLKVEALTANPAVLTCLANDISYDEVFAEQLRHKAGPGDVLLVLSGSGNSRNIVRALEVANGLGVMTFAILGYSGGRCRDLADVPIHFAVEDMQVSEDLQLVVGHMCMQWVSRELAKSQAAVS